MKNQTQADGLATQAKQMKRWRSVLIPAKYHELAVLVGNENLKLKATDQGEDVFRGNSIDMLVHNRLMETI